MTTPKTNAVEFDTSGLDVWTDPEHFEVTAERIAEYAAATNDPIERHLKGEIAPPVFAVVPVFMSMAPRCAVGGAGRTADEARSR